MDVSTKGQNGELNEEARAGVVALPVPGRASAEQQVNRVRVSPLVEEERGGPVPAQVDRAIGGVPVAPTDGALLLSVAEAAKALGVSRGSLYELVNAGEVKSIQIGRRRLIPRTALIEFIDGNTASGRGR